MNAVLPVLPVLLLRLAPVNAAASGRVAGWLLAAAAAAASYGTVELQQRY
jgi:hypothetical protein